MLTKYTARTPYCQEGNTFGFELMDLCDGNTPMIRIPVYHSYVDKGVVYTDTSELPRATGIEDE